VRQATAQRLAAYRQQLNEVTVAFDELVDVHVEHRKQRERLNAAVSAAVRQDAARILATLPADPPEVIAQRRAVLASLSGAA
jgi:hypothetical protein